MSAEIEADRVIARVDVLLPQLRGVLQGQPHDVAVSALICALSEQIVVSQDSQPAAHAALGSVIPILARSVDDLARAALPSRSGRGRRSGL